MDHGIFFFSVVKIQIRNLIVFSPDDTNTPCSVSDQLDEMRSIIDRDIARLEKSIRGPEDSIRSLEDSIRALKSRRNDLSSTSRLPAEILCNIFSLSILSSPGHPESWTNFSQVSQRWRLLALSAPELWTNIPVSYPRWTQEMLIRSKMAKLTILSNSFETPKSKTMEAIKSCLYEMNRVEAIHIACGIPGLEEIFRDLPKSAPQLRTLRIGSYWPRSSTAFSIHKDFLYDTERLQRVELINCKIGWDSRLLTGLTCLILELDDSLKANSSINQFLHALQRMPALIELRLKDSIPDDSEDPSTYPDVDLPCLRVLDISSGVSALTVVLRHITIPHSAILNLTCKEKQSTQVDFSNFLSVLSTKFLSSLVLRRLTLQGSEIFDNTETDCFVFYFWTTAAIRDYLPYSQSQVRLVLTWPPSPQHRHAKALTCFFGAMSLPFLTQLHISTFRYIDSQTWVKTFGTLPLLERVCVQGFATKSFLEALVYKTKTAEKSILAYRDVSFPKLRYIYLKDTHVGTRRLGSVSLDMLLHCLMERCERNAEVPVLRLDGCHYVSSDNVARLKEIVVDVIRV